MTKKDYKLLVDVFGHAWNRSNSIEARTGQWNVMEILKKELKADNPNFDAEKFEQAIQNKITKLTTE